MDQVVSQREILRATGAVAMASIEPMSADELGSGRAIRSAGRDRLRRHRVHHRALLPNL